METATALDQFVKSNVSLFALFKSETITLDDTDAFVRLLKVLVGEAQAEIQEQLGQNFELLPVVSVSPGSIALEIEIKVSSLTLKTTFRDVFFAIALILNPSAAVDNIPPQLTRTCERNIETALQEAQKTWQYFGKGFTAEFDASCGDEKIHSTITVPSVSKHNYATN
jgi:hypothetical protein